MYCPESGLIAEEGGERRCTMIPPARGGGSFRSASQIIWLRLLCEKKQSIRAAEVHFAAYHISQYMCMVSKRSC